MSLRLAHTALGASLLAAIVVTATPAPATAHEFRPTVLRVDLRADGAHAMTWKWDGNDPAGIPASQLGFPDTCEVELRDATVGTERVAHFSFRCSDDAFSVAFPREPQELVLDLRVDSTPLRVERLTGDLSSVDLRARALQIDAGGGHSESVPRRLVPWLVLGVEHIIFGWDHLCFVFALTLLVGSWRRLLVVVTGFTVGHSITLGGAALGALPEPSSGPVEAVIALSIVYLAVELTRDADARERFGRSLGLGVSVGFGLVHGFGFAGALAEIGLPEGREVLALAGFNLGVELGAGGVRRRRLDRRRARSAPRGGFRALPPPGPDRRRLRRRLHRGLLDDRASDRGAQLTSSRGVWALVAPPNVVCKK